MLAKFLGGAALVIMAAAAMPGMADSGSPFYTTTGAGNDHLVSKLLGRNVYDSDASNAKTLGEINDMIVDSGGHIQAVVIGVGGFLGMGEKDVAVNYSSIKWMHQANSNSLIAVVPTTKDSLKNAPAFDTARLDSAGSTSSTNAATTSASTMAPATNNSTMASATSTQADLTPIKASTISANKLKDSTVYSADNKDLGTVNDVLLGKDGKISAVVLDVGGFLGMGAKPVAIAFESLQFMTDTNSHIYVHTKFTKAELEKAPTYDKNTYTRDPQSVTLSSKS